MHQHYSLEKSCNSFFGTGIRYWLGRLSIEAYPFTKSFGIEFNINDDFGYTFSFNMSLPFLFSFYINYNSDYLLKKGWIRKIVGYKYGNRRTGLRIHHWTIWTEFWLGEDNCGTIGNKWRGIENAFHIDDFFLGRIKYDKKEIETGEVDFTVPEGYGYKEKDYTGKWKKELFIRKRPRWFIDSNIRYDLEVENGVPYTGKGTTGYNCEEGACHSLSSPCKNEKEIVQKFIDSVMYNRKNYPL